MENAEVVKNEIIDMAEHIAEADPVKATEVVTKRGNSAFVGGAIASGATIAALYLSYKYIVRPLWAKHKTKGRQPEVIHAEGIEIDMNDEAAPEEDED